MPCANLEGEILKCIKIAIKNRFDFRIKCNDKGAVYLYYKLIKNVIVIGPFCLNKRSKGVHQSPVVRYPLKLYDNVSIILSYFF
jgi:hypothetical protein